MDFNSFSEFLHQKDISNSRMSYRDCATISCLTFKSFRTIFNNISILQINYI